ncbi:ATP-dependent Clp protease proteolytic subunit [compost metagenome]
MPQPHLKPMNRLQQLLNDNAQTPRHYRCQTTANETTLWLYDVIGADAWGGVSAAQFVQDLAAIETPVIHLRINSPGGDVFDARAIVTALREHPARIIAHIDGLAASAASYVALAADEVEISEGAFLMIHNAWGVVIGNRHDLLEMALTLEKIDASIVADYQRRTGQSAQRIAQWMDAESWFTAQEALDEGWVDRLAQPSYEPKQHWNLAAYPEAPADIQPHASPVIAEHERWRRVAVIERTA